MSRIRNLLISVIALLRGILLRNDALRSLVYDINNEAEFTNLYEHEKMLADSVRVNCYWKAIQKYIKPGNVVLDLGTGTGILSFFAARQKPKKIYAIDHSDFINIARITADHNNITGIEFVKSNSRYFKPDLKIDYIIHEQIGDYLFNENMIKNLLDLKSRVLRSEGMIFPGKFELYLEPTNLAESYRIPFIFNNKLHGIDFGFLKNHHDDLQRYKAKDYKQQWICQAAVEYFLCETAPVMTFDLNTMESEDEIQHTVEISRPVANKGSFDGFCLFFKVIFDEDISFDTSPLSPSTHWGNCFFRAESKSCSQGDIINCKLSMPNLLDIKTWSVQSG